MKSLVVASAAAVMTAASSNAFAQATGSPSSPDISTITSNLNYSTWVIPGMISVAAALAVLYVARGGISVVMGMIKSAR